MLLIVIFTLIIALFWVLAVKTEMLRDPHTCQIPEGRNTYSLARTQFGLWTVIIFCSFVYLVKIKDLSEIKFTQQVAILLGVSAGTTVISRSIDSNSPKPRLKNAAVSHGCSKGFLIDILSDQNGISVHRFQQVVFTLVLIYVYTALLIKTKNFPEIDEYLLLLAGFSSGGYLGVKITNKN